MILTKQLVEWAIKNCAADDDADADDGDDDADDADDGDDDDDAHHDHQHHHKNEINCYFVAVSLPTLSRRLFSVKSLMKLSLQQKKLLITFILFLSF